MLTAPEVARLLGLKPRTVYALGLPCYRFGRAVRFDPAAHVALAELVALKDMKDHLTALRSDPYYVTQADALESQYKARKPAAWEAARAAVKEG